MINIKKLKFEVLFHAPYAPDLTPSDYFIFPNLKKLLGDKRFANNEELKSAIVDYFEDLNGSQHKQCNEFIEHHWEKCIQLN